VLARRKKSLSWPLLPLRAQHCASSTAASPLPPQHAQARLGFDIFNPKPAPFIELPPTLQA